MPAVIFGDRDSTHSAPKVGSAVQLMFALRGLHRLTERTLAPNQGIGSKRPAFRGIFTAQDFDDTNAGRPIFLQRLPGMTGK
jgi:hypothetical protein